MQPFHRFLNERLIRGGRPTLDLHLYKVLALDPHHMDLEHILQTWLRLSNRNAFSLPSSEGTPFPQQRVVLFQLVLWPGQLP
jgi:hypothetical protein